MASILVQRPDSGLNSLFPDNIIDPRAAVKGSENVLYENGIVRTAFGFIKVDLTTGLNSTDVVLSVVPFVELDGYSHLIAVTTERIYENNRAASTWDDITQASKVLNANISHIVSSVAIAHQDTNIYIDDDSAKSKAYYHLIVSDGGLSDIQRWAGRYEQDFADVVGGGGYHGGTTHRAVHVGAYQNRLILLSPREYSATSKSWVENPQRVRWPVIARLQTWTGTGSGFADLVDTGGINQWAAALGNQYIIYQDNSIWSLNYVGGTSVFSPVINMPDLGLMSGGLMVSTKNVHYFVGSDYNVYAYYGGSIKQNIGEKIYKFLKDDLDTDYKDRCRMTLDLDGKRLWIFIVPSGSVYVRKAYVYDFRFQNWTVIDFSTIFGSTSGITAACLIGTETYTVGDTYQEELDTLSAYDGEGGGDLPQRYGDLVLDSSITLSAGADISLTTWKPVGGGGLDCSKAGGNFKNDFTTNDILMVADGSSGTNVQQGTHFYTVYDVSTNGFSVYSRHNEDVKKMVFTSGGIYNIHLADTLDGTTSAASACVAGVVVHGGSWALGTACGVTLLTNQTGAFQAGETLNVGSNLNVGTVQADSAIVGLVGVADASNTVPSVIYSKSGHDPAADAVVYSACSYNNPGQTYNQILEEIRVDGRLVIGDNSGFVYQFNEDATYFDTIDISGIYRTCVFDYAEPDTYKRWERLSYTAKEKTSGNGGIKVRSRTASFDTSTTGWTDITQALTSDYEEYDCFVNKSSKRIQFQFDNCTQTDYELREFQLIANIEENR